MIIQINSVHSSDSGLVVNFTSPIGSASAVWVGAIPKERESHDVEINFEEDFIWGKNIWGAAAAPSIKPLFDCGASITAELLHYDSDGCAAIKLGGLVTLIEVSGIPKDLPKSIKLEANLVKIYPTNI